MGGGFFFPPTENSILPEKNVVPNWNSDPAPPKSVWPPACSPHVSTRNGNLYCKSLLTPNHKFSTLFLSAMGDAKETADMCGNR